MWQATQDINEKLTQLIPANQLSTLLKVSNALASSLELQEVLQIAISSVTDLLGIETGAIYTLDGDYLCLGATTPPLPSEFPDELRLANLNDHPHIKEAIRSKKHTYLSDARNADLTSAERAVVDARQLVSILYFPLLLKGEAIGAFIVGTTSEVRSFSKGEIDLSNVFSCQSSLATTNAQMYKETQQAMLSVTQAYDETLEGWSRVLDIRDHVTDEHTRRVANLKVELAFQIRSYKNRMYLRMMN